MITGLTWDVRQTIIALVRHCIIRILVEMWTAQVVIRIVMVEPLQHLRHSVIQIVQ